MVLKAHSSSCHFGICVLLERKVKLSELQETDLYPYRRNMYGLCFSITAAFPLLFTPT